MRRFAAAGGWLWLAAMTTVGQGGPPSPLSLEHIEWRHLGPAAFGGRVPDLEAVAGTSTIYVGAAAGGVFRSTNNGVTWTPIFDHAGGSLSVGDLAVAPSDPDIVWVGTGEANNRQSSSWGDGVYRTLDGGTTWLHMGLRDTHHIGRVAIHPANPDVVYIAAAGHLWGPNEERGVFRTTDGGRTWRKVLYVDADTGFIDLTLSFDGRTLFAAAYQRRRRAWGFDGGGPGGGIFRSLDGGDTWNRLRGGLPEGVVGRIGLALSRSDRRIVYAIVESDRGGVFCSTDGGDTWVRRSSFNPRPMYYSKIRVNPQNPDDLWVLGAELFHSIDGGRTFTRGISGDHHALWIDPDNPRRLILGSDHGVRMSYDAGEHWELNARLPIAQFYRIAADLQTPYRIFGGTQDNGSWLVPSRAFSARGITNADVRKIAFGDGFQTAIDPRDPRFVYANSQDGRMYLVDLDARTERVIRPFGESADEYRFNWTTPVLVSRHDPTLLYAGAQRLLRSRDRGASWEAIGPDLTRNQRWQELPVMGRRGPSTLSRDDGVTFFGTLTTIAESPVDPRLLYAGTDDGQVQVTRDGGAAWTDLTGNFRLPGTPWVSRVAASFHDRHTAFAALDGHRDDDFTPYLFRTTDGGRSWTNIAGGIPPGCVVKSFAEHPRNPRLLFAGTEFGLYVTIDGGQSWARVAVPRAPIDDIVIHERENDVILGTHGRGMIVLDDAGLLEGADEGLLASDGHLFPIRRAVQWSASRQPPVSGEFTAPNPDPGVLISYYLGPGDAGGRMRLVVRDSGGRIVREMEGPAKAGFNRTSWDLRYGLPAALAGDEGGWYATRAPLVLPGRYDVGLFARGVEAHQTVEVASDPRIDTSPGDLRVRHDESIRLVALVEKDAAAAERVARIRALVDARAALADDGASRRELDRQRELLGDLAPLFGAGGAVRSRALDLLGQIQAYPAAPTAAQSRAVRQLESALDAHLARLEAADRIARGSGL
jgi:photosystem II stability/assembly factor-like uncharacterized protein